MRRAIHCGVLAFLAVSLLPAASVGIYFNEADWQSAFSNQLTSIDFDNSDWTSSLHYANNYTSMVSQSSTAASNGMNLSVISGYGAPGFVDNSTLGHVSNGEFVDAISKYGGTTFQFGDNIYGFGGYFNIAGSNGLYLGPAGNLITPTTGSTPAYSGFIGIITDQPMDNFFISWGDNGCCYGCYSNSYTLSDLQVATLPTPEPNFKYFFAGLLILALGYAGSKPS
jgi:hypothetical protein